MNDGVLVSREWCERVNNALFGGKDGGQEGKSGSRFYDVRPVVLTSSEWMTDDAGRYSLATFEEDANTQIKAYAPSSMNTDVTPHGKSYYAVWRGKWEIIGGETVDVESILNDKTREIVVTTGLSATTTTMGWLRINVSSTNISFYGP